MHIIWSMIVGLIVGGIAKVIMPGKDPGGLVVTMLLGLGGALLAGIIGTAAGIYRAGATGPGIFASVLGAVLVLAAYRLTRGRRTA